MALRLAIPALTGATFSLSLLYLYHSSLITHQVDLEKSILSSSETLRELRDKRDRLLRGHEVQGAGEEVKDGLTKSRFQPAKYSSLGDEIRTKWNTHLLNLTHTLSNTRADDVVLSSIATATYWSKALWGAVSGSGSTGGPSVKPLLGDVKTVYSSDAKHTLSLRSEEDRRVLVKESTGLDVKGGRLA